MRGCSFSGRRSYTSWRRFFAGLSLLIVTTFVVACDRGDAQRGNGAPTVDVPLMAFLSEARALHHEANLHEAANDIPGALRALERLVAAKRPAGLPEIDEVLADTHARLAELRTRNGDFAGAARDVEDGLKLAPARTYFRGHLFEVSGVVEEARAASLEDAGKTDEAARARANAVTLLRQAVAIQDEVIRATLDDGGARPGNEGQKR